MRSQCGELTVTLNRKTSRHRFPQITWRQSRTQVRSAECHRVRLGSSGRAASVCRFSGLIARETIILDDQSSVNKELLLNHLWDGLTQ